MPNTLTSRSTQKESTTNWKLMVTKVMPATHSMIHGTGPTIVHSPPITGK